MKDTVGAIGEVVDDIDTERHVKLCVGQAGAFGPARGDPVASSETESQCQENLDRRRTT